MTTTSLPKAPPSGFDDRLTAFPRYVMYDVNNLCNARCPFCPQTALARADDFAPQQLDWSVFTSTIEEVANYPEVELVRFTGDGEPLLHPRISDMIALAKKLGIRKTNLTTNGSLLSGRRLDAILEAAPDVIDISLDAFRPETYAKYRIGLDFETTMENVAALLERRDPTRIKVVVSMIHHSGLDEEVSEFRKFWAGRADAVAVRRPHTNIGLTPTEVEYERPPRWPCIHLWQRLVIDFRGHVRFCPIDWRDRSFLAEVGSASLHAIWHGPVMAELRRRHRENQYSGCGVCENCTDWASSPWSEGWIDFMNRGALQSGRNDSAKT